MEPLDRYRLENELKFTCDDRTRQSCLNKLEFAANRDEQDELIELYTYLGWIKRGSDK